MAALAVGAAVLAVPASASAFGTINGLGQHAEHEQITRVLACGAEDGVARCFQPASIAMLAGSKGSIGGVGLPDRILEVLGHGDAHCDDADYLPGLPYRTDIARRAVQAIDDCVTLFGRHLDQAVAAAGGLADDRVIFRQQADATDGCPWDLTGSFGVNLGDASAKCQVVEGLGRALHAAEDFWSHSNWADQADPSRPTVMPADNAAKTAAGRQAPGRDAETGAPVGEQGASDTPPATDPATDAPEGADGPSAGPDDAGEPLTYNVANPRGLGRTELVPFLRYPVQRDLLPTEQEMRDGSAPITGCDDSADDMANKLPGVRVSSCPDRITHSTVNKDKGLIDWRTGRTSESGTARGQVADNFQRAVTGARAQARAIWEDFSAAVMLRYGSARGELILQALTQDTPWTACRVSGTSPFAQDAPSGGRPALRSVTASIENRTGHPLICGSMVLDSGVWGYLPADRIEPGQTATFRTESNLASINLNRVKVASGGPEGSGTYAIGTTGYAVQVRWDNPIVGGNSYGCQFLRDGAPANDAPFRCARQGGSGNDSRPVFTVTAR